MWTLNPAWIIAKRELRYNFDSFIAYLLISGFLLFTGAFTWLNQASNVFAIKQADLGVFFGVARWTLFFFIPAMTMRLLAEERKNGTFELLLTKPVTKAQVVIGKFIATWLMIGIALALTLPYYISIAYIGEIDHGATISGYLGLILMSAAYIAIGLLAGSFTDNQIVALLVALFMGIFFQLLFDLTGSYLPGTLGEMLYFLSFNQHLDALSRGVLDIKDLLFFISVTALALIFAIRNLRADI
ncbi:MAG: ABC transporter permease subunit [Saprospiraceae bacterium]|nr:ABC transporter permease subunit [Saprospiraceae bacterium]